MTQFGGPLPTPLAGLVGPGGRGDRDADPVPGLVGFAAALRHAGLAVTTDRVAAFLTARATSPQRSRIFGATSRQ